MERNGPEIAVVDLYVVRVPSHQTPVAGPLTQGQGRRFE
jgi:hypothetical protein